MKTPDWIFIGLGNPGPRYAMTRHNIGFIALDVLAQECRGNFSKTGLAQKCRAELAEISWAGKNILLLKPQTFMNLSGESLQQLYQQQSHFRDAPVLVLHDEVDIAFARFRVKMGGSDAGHNGLKSVRAHLGHGDFYRLRMGVGRPPQGAPISVADYVLQSFNDQEQPKLLDVVHRTLSIAESLLTKNLQSAQELAAKDL